MSFKDLFLEFLRKGHIEKPKQKSPYDIPGIYESDANFILSTHYLSKYADREFYGGGATAAEARRRQRLGIEEEIKESVTKVHKKRRLFSKQRRLERRIEKLKKDIARLESEKRKKETV